MNDSFAVWSACPFATRWRDWVDGDFRRGMGSRLLARTRPVKKWASPLKPAAPQTLAARSTVARTVVPYWSCASADCALRPTSDGRTGGSLRSGAFSSPRRALEDDWSSGCSGCSQFSAYRRNLAGPLPKRGTASARPKAHSWHKANTLVEPCMGRSPSLHIATLPGRSAERARRPRRLPDYDASFTSRNLPRPIENRRRLLLSASTYAASG